MQRRRAFCILLVAMILGTLGSAEATMAAETCVLTPTRHCLIGGRFAVETSFSDGHINPRPGQVIRLPGTDAHAAAFWFFDSENPEFIVKILDGRPVNGHFWIFYAGLTSLRVKLMVTDTLTGIRKTYLSDLGTLASQADTGTFLAGASRTSMDRWAFPADPEPEPTKASTLVADFTYSPASPSVGSQVTFTDQSNGSPDHWCWTFGDGDTGSGCSSTQPVATHTYTSAGTYSVVLSVSRSNGNSLDVSTVVKSITMAGSPPPPTCTFDLSVKPVAFGVDGGSGTVTVAASAPDCTWTAESRASFLHLPLTSGSGSGTISFQVDPNDSGAARTGNLIVAGQTLTVSQSARPCTFAIDPSQVTLTRAGQVSSVAVDASDGCAWSASFASGSEFITLLSPASGTGPGVLRFQVAPNPGSASRSGELTIAGQPFQVEQLAVDFAVDFFFSPPSAATGSPVSFFATATEPPASWCWTFGDGTPESCAAQAQVTHRYVSAGMYTVKLKGLRNGGGSAETTKVITVSAIGGGCGGLSTHAILKGEAVISPAFQSFDFNGGSGSVLVTTGDCKWTAESEADFVTVAAAAGGPGPGSVQYQVAPNPGRARTGVIRIAGRIFLVLQAGKPCVSLDPSSANAAAGGGTYTVGVKAPTDCSWTAVSNDEPFLHVTKVSADHGSGTVTYRVNANTTGAVRAGSLSIGGASFAVSQEPCTYSFVPPGVDPVDHAGGIGAVLVQAQEGCLWTVTTPDPFVRFPVPPTGKGTGSFKYCVAANRGAARSVTFTAPNAEVELPQAGFDPPLAGCQSTDTSLCLLENRFEIRLAFLTPGGDGVGSSIRLNERSGYFTFFDPTNPEILLKMIDGRPVNSHFWLFYGAMSNVDYVVTATDTVTGEAQLYCNPSGTFRSVGDTLAFPRP